MGKIRMSLLINVAIILVVIVAIVGTTCAVEKKLHKKGLIKTTKISLVKTAAKITVKK